MAKVSYLKVELVLKEELHRLTVDRLKELGAIATLLSESQPKISEKTIEDILERFRKELKKLKARDPNFYARLEISEEDENRFSLPGKELIQADWLRLKLIHEKIEELKKERYGKQISSEEDEKQIEEERIKHINKRFNVRDGWLPLK